MRARSSSNRRRRGATVVEAAIVLPTVFLFIIGMCVISLGTYRYQQVASLAREGARYASVHGSQFYAATETDYLSSDIISNAITPMAVGLNPNNLTCHVQWGTAANARGTWVWNDDSSGKGFESKTALPASYNPNSTPPGEPIYNAVKVTVTYAWSPELYLTGPINLMSTSVMPMSF
jgi:Flp pilus assembly protein TadG